MSLTSISCKLLDHIICSNLNLSSQVPHRAQYLALPYSSFILMTFRNTLQTAQCDSFADNTLLYVTIYSTSDCIKLREDLDNLERWESDLQMSFHPEKYEVFHIKKKPILHKYTMRYGPSPFSLMCSLLLKDLSFNFYLLLLQLVLCRVAALKSLPVHHP